MLIRISKLYIAITPDDRPEPLTIDLITLSILTKTFPENGKVPVFAMEAEAVVAINALAERMRQRRMCKVDLIIRGTHALFVVETRKTWKIAGQQETHMIQSTHEMFYWIDVWEVTNFEQHGLIEHVSNWKAHHYMERQGDVLWQNWTRRIYEYLGRTT
jgi:hypothetical protein